MITLYTFGPYFGLPDGSPFVTKAMLLLKIAGMDYVENRNGYRAAPKGKLPFIDDEGEKIADTTFIRRHIEQKYRLDFDAGLSPEQKAVAWALEKMCEDHLYWLIIADRWLDDASFAKGPAHFFDAAPAPVRPLLRLAIRRKVRKAAWEQGLFRHTAEQRLALAKTDFAAISTLLGDKPYLFGDQPRGVDAAVGAFVIGGLCPHFDGACRQASESFANLSAYGARIVEHFF